MHSEINKRKMKLQKKTLRKWMILRDVGDIKRLKETTNISSPTLIKAFKGEASIKTMNAINAFYDQRRKELNLIK